jgi:hypothetical protein
MEEVYEVDGLGLDEPRVVAVSLVDAQTGRELVKTTLIKVLATQQSTSDTIRKNHGSVKQVFHRAVHGKITEIRGGDSVHALGLAHHDKLFCVLDEIVHAVRCARCKIAPIVGIRYHVKGFSTNLCAACAAIAAPGIRKLLEPVLFSVDPRVASH